MSSRGSLIALSVVAALLALAVALDGSRGPATRADARLLPELRDRELARITWRRAGEPDLVAEHTGDGWMITAPVEAPVDRGAIDDVVGALELLRPRRHVADAEVITPHTTLALQLRGGDVITLALGDRVEAARQRFIARRDRAGAFLIDEYPGRVLDARADDLRSRRAIAVPPEPSSIAIFAPDATLQLSGRPLGVHLTGLPNKARVRPAVAAELVATLTGLRFERFADAPDAAPAWSLKVDGEALAFFELCDGDHTVLARGAGGAGCIEAGAVVGLLALTGGGLELVDPRALRAAPDDVVRIELPDGALDRSGARWQWDDGRPADADAVTAWLTELAAVTGAVEVAPERPPPPAWRVALVDARGEREELVVYDAGFVQRAGEPVWLRAAAPAPSALAFRPRPVIDEQPTALRTVEVAGTRIERGELIGEWRAAGRTVDAGAVETLRAAVARLRAARWIADEPGARRPARVLAIEFDPPPTGGEPARYELSITRGCEAWLTGGAVFAVDAATCEALLAPLWR